MGKEKYKLEEYDLNLLREARHRVARVAGYHFGAPNSKSILNRLETILHKLDCILEECENNG